MQHGRNFSSSLFFSSETALPEAVILQRSSMMSLQRKNEPCLNRHAVSLIDNLPRRFFQDQIGLRLRDGEIGTDAVSWIGG